MSGRPNTQWLETMVKKHGSREAVTEVMREVGRKGGSVKGTQGGFASMTPEERSAAGKKGGAKSKRGPAKKTYNEGTIWIDQIASSPASRFITKQQIETCASCHESFEKNTTLDDMGLCPECPKTEAPRRGFFSQWKPF